MDLTALQHSPFLQSLGWAIANSLWQAAALWIAYLLINGVYRGATAKFKNTLATVLISSVFVWFCITFFIRYFAIDNSGTYTLQYYETDNNSVVTYKWTELFDKMAAMLPYLSAAYLLLLIFLSLRLINVYRFTSFIKSHGLQKPGAEWKLFTEKVAMHMGITRKIRLWVSHHIDVPATIGFIKPVILIPVASINQLSADQLEAIILHELSHIKRNDYLINLFVSIIETLLFFNPFVVLLGRIIKRERENCCDDFVIQYQYDRHAYASALLSLEQFRNINLKLAIGATSGKKQLFLRIKRIMEINSNTNFNYGQKLAALFLITGIICSVAWLSPQNNENKKQQAGKAQNNTIEQKIIKDEKPGNIFLNVAENKISGISLKQQPKKTITKSISELKNLSLKEIAEREYKRSNQLLLESKKQITLKKPEKYSANKFYMANGTGVTPSMWNTATTGMTAFKTMADNIDFYRLHSYSVADLQKMQAELEKAKFSYSFDCDNMQEAVKLAFSKQLKNLQIQQGSKNKYNEKIVDKIVKTETLTPGGNTVKRQMSHPLTMPGFHEATLFYIDSLTATESKAYIHTQQSGNTGVKTPIPVEIRTAPLPMAYAYGYSFDTEEKDKVKRNSEKTLERTRIAEGRHTTAAPVISGTRLRLIQKNEELSKVVLPKTTVSETDNIRLEYKNGIVYLNGKEINVADKNGTTLFTIKGKKAPAKVKDINIDTNDD